MTEAEQAIRLAHIVLDRRNADPDDDFAILARQLLRALDRESAAFAQGAEQRTEQIVFLLDERHADDEFDNWIPCGNLIEVIRELPLPTPSPDWLERKLAEETNACAEVANSLTTRFPHCTIELRECARLILRRTESASRAAEQTKGGER